MPKKIALLGSTGSIGTQALDVIKRYPDEFSVEVLTAGNNVDLLSRQAREFLPDAVVIGNEDHLKELKENLYGTGVKVYSGSKATEQVVADSEAELVLAAIVGYSGLNPVISSIKAGKRIALANKETLVVAGALINNIVREHKSMIIPVDSEHSAIFQCLKGEEDNDVEHITLTASGGPFLNLSYEDLKTVKPGDALRHPNWCMGDKVTIDSASMMNKGLEVIEARWLFNLEPARIKVIIHPQSIIHSFVHFNDGSIKAQLGVPDMRLPILYALSYPRRLPSQLPRLDLNSRSPFTFMDPDLKKFRNLTLAFDAIKEGGNMPCTLNAANEIAVNAFLTGKIGFLQMPDTVEYALEKNTYIASPDLESLEFTDKTGRDNAEIYINKLLNRK